MKRDLLCRKSGAAVLAVSLAFSLFPKIAGNDSVDGAKITVPYAITGADSANATQVSDAAPFSTLKSGCSLNDPFSKVQTVRTRKWNYRAKSVFSRNALYKF